MIDNLKKIKITAASGENHFVMDRGCFTYDQETTNPEVLSFIGTNDTTSGFESRYEAGDEKFVIKARTPSLSGTAAWLHVRLQEKIQERASENTATGTLDLLLNSDAKPPLK